MSRRFFVEPLIGEQTSVTLAGPEAHHLLHVMRLRVGDKAVLFDGAGCEYRAEVEKLGRSDATFTVLERREADRELPIHLELAVALPKGDRQKTLVEKLVELGVTRLVPLETARGVAQPSDKALERLQRGVIEASKQCGRNRLMEIAAAVGFDDYLAVERDAAALRLFAHPGGHRVANVWPTATAKTPAVYVAIGPEGGFSDDEAAAAQLADWQAIGLGRRILRIETAAAAMAALAAAQFED